jgi:hypothetical protein
MKPWFRIWITKKCWTNSSIIQQFYIYYISQAIIIISCQNKTSGRPRAHNLPVYLRTLLDASRCTDTRLLYRAAWWSALGPSSEPSTGLPCWSSVPSWRCGRSLLLRWLNGWTRTWHASDTSAATKLACLRHKYKSKQKHISISPIVGIGVQHLYYITSATRQMTLKHAFCF